MAESVDVPVPATSSGTTTIAGVIGHPVAHSLSPAIHNAAFVAVDIDWMYAAFDVAPGRAGEAVEAMRALGLGGLSVTMPHKAAVVAELDRISPTAQALGAVNCVGWDGPELVGHNTDGAGFIDSLGSMSDRLGELSVIVAGAGGAAKAVVRALGEAGAADIAVWNRTTARAEEAVALGGPTARVAATAVCRGFDLVVNATSLGMAGTSTADLDPFDVGDLHQGHTVIDLVYNPIETRLLVGAAKAGAVAIDGVAMLVHQAAHQFRIWTGLEPPVQIMTAAARASIMGGR